MWVCVDGVHVCVCVRKHAYVYMCVSGYMKMCMWLRDDVCVCMCDSLRKDVCVHIRECACI